MRSLLHRRAIAEHIRGCFIQGDPFDQSYNDTLSQGRPPVRPDAASAGEEPRVVFPGITRPNSDFQAVRDGRRSTLLGYMVDLSSARSIAAGTQLTLPVTGNVVLCDPLYDLSGNSQAGIARIHFQDLSLNPVGTYVTALPNAIYKVPFTQLLIENYAQSGKFLYIVYGVDIDLLPGNSQVVQATILNLAQQSIGGVNSLVTTERGFAYGASFASNTALAATTNEQIIAPGTNVNGVILWRFVASIIGATAATQYGMSLLAKSSAPASSIDGDLIDCGLSDPLTAASQVGFRTSLERPVFIAAGKGLYRRSGAGAEGGALVNALYTVL